MIEQEHQALQDGDPTPPAINIEHIEPGPAVEFALLPGQRLELSFSPEGVIRLQVVAPEPMIGIERPVTPVEPTPPAVPQKEAQQRVTIAGRVGSPATFRTTKKGAKIAHFTVAEHPDTEATTWRTILAFGERAEGLAQQPLEKGQAVEVIGYPHPRDVTTNGVKKTVEEIYATAIKRR